MALRADQIVWSPRFYDALDRILQDYAHTNRSIDSIFGSSPLLIYLAGHRHLPMTSTFERDATQLQKVLSEALLTIELSLADQILFEASRPIKRSFVWIERR